MDRRTEGQKDGRMDGQTLFYRTLPATAGGPKRKKRRERREKNEMKHIAVNAYFVILLL